MRGRGRVNGRSAPRPWAGAASRCWRTGWGSTSPAHALALAAGGGDLQAAVDGVAAVVGRIGREFRATGARLLDTAQGRSSAVCRCVKALQRAIAGNLEWSYLTPRHNGRGRVWNGDTTATSS
ncbi:hypothetical protein ACQI4E_29350 [Streptomyces sp. CA-252508]|uniref:hypothetical protein n=1 Tax=Streptomyces sp. CA-252508 TaxID=3418946 RepID=UPI003D905A6A